MRRRPTASVVNHLEPPPWRPPVDRLRRRRAAFPSLVCERFLKVNRQGESRPMLITPPCHDAPAWQEWWIIARLACVISVAATISITLRLARCIAVALGRAARPPREYLRVIASA